MTIHVKPERTGSIGILFFFFAATLLYAVLFLGMPISQAEFGGIVTPDLTNGSLVTSATVQLYNYALESNYLGFGTDSGYTVPLTLTLYSVGTNGAVGSVIQSSTTDAAIAWAAGQAPDGVQVSFSFDAPVSSSFIYGLSFDTADYGASPTGVDGPYDSLNFGVTLSPATTGTNPALVNVTGDPCPDPSTIGVTCFLPSSNYYDSAYSNTPWLAPNTYGTPGTFSQDTYWISSGAGSGMVEFDASLSSTPEPGTLGLIGFGLVAFAAVARKRTRR